jgi:hypothetical protein
VNRTPIAWRLLCAVLLTLCCLSGAQAHDARPAYLEITETAPGRYDILWRTPVAAGARLPLQLKLPDDARTISAPHERILADSVLERRIVEVPGGLAGKRVEIVGLQGTITDVLARVQMLDGASSTTLIQPSRPWLDVAAARSGWETAASFLRHGVEHIAFGIDHLLFVFGLLLLVRTPWALLKTVTAFTLAHSITLALATLGIVRVAPTLVEAFIALSILFLGAEVLRAWRGETSFTIRKPWLVAFGFGLLHGLGFASGLRAIGLPQGDIPLALLMFNLGVELGQLAFVGVVLLAWKAIKTVRIAWPAWAAFVPAYLVGSLGAFWFVQRTMTLF